MFDRLQEKYDNEIKHRKAAVRSRQFEIGGYTVSAAAALVLADLILTGGAFTAGTLTLKAAIAGVTTLAGLGTGIYAGWRKRKNRGDEVFWRDNHSYGDVEPLTGWVRGKKVNPRAI